MRSTSLEALRYTQFVGVMKRALPTAAFAVIAAVLAFFFVARQPDKVSMTYERLGAIKNDLAMIKPHLTGADAKGNPFVITAETAIQDVKNPKRAKLRKVEADLTLDNNGWLNVNAAGGAGGHAGGQPAARWRHRCLFRQRLYFAQPGGIGGPQEMGGHGP